MNKIIHLAFGENNKIEISNISNTNIDLSESERKSQGDLEYKLFFQSDGFQVLLNVRDLLSGIKIFKSDLEKMYNQLSGEAVWYNSDVAGFGLENNFYFQFQMENTGTINLVFEVNSKNTELKHLGEIDQSYLPDWINELEKLIQG